MIPSTHISFSLSYFYLFSEHKLITLKLLYEKLIETFHQETKVLNSQSPCGSFMLD